MLTRLPAPCSVLPITDFCSCGSKWMRQEHAMYDLTESVCPLCGSRPHRYIVRVVVNGEKREYRYDHMGRPLRTVQAVVAAAKQIHEALADGTHVRSKHRRSPIYETLPDFIGRHVMKHVTLTETEREFLEDFMAPYFNDVGLFALCQVHLRQFIRTFSLKGERKEMAERLFERVTSEICF